MVNYFENVVNEISSTNDDATPADIGRIVWNWLANELEKEADLTIILSSIQVLAENTS